LASPLMMTYAGGCHSSIYKILLGWFSIRHLHSLLKKE